MKKERLDTLLIARNMVDTIEKARAHIMSFNILVDDRVVSKSGEKVAKDSRLRFKKPPSKYVSRGGEKLAGAFSSFKCSCEGKTALDIGLSTGGFSDYLLQNKTSTVIGVDVGYGDVNLKVREHPDAIIIERTNARNISKSDLLKHMSDSLLNEISLVVMDVSFISILKIIPAITEVTGENTDFVLLVKPQFECDKEDLPPGAVIKDPGIHQKIMTTVSKRLSEMGLKIMDTCESPIHGKKGNKEFFIWAQN